MRSGGHDVAEYRIKTTRRESGAEDFRNIITLSCIRNKIFPVFAAEALWAVAVMSAPSRQLDSETQFVLLSGDAGFTGAISKIVRPALAAAPTSASACSFSSSSPSLRRVHDDVLFLGAAFNHLMLADERSGGRDLLQRTTTSLYQMVDRDILSLSGPGNDALDLRAEDSAEHVPFAAILQSRGVCVSSTSAKFSNFLASLLLPFIDSFYIASASLFLLLEHQSAGMERGMLVRRMSSLGDSMYRHGSLWHYEACSQVYLSQCLDVIASWSIVKLVEKTLPRVPAQPKQMVSNVVLNAKFCSKRALHALLDRIARYRRKSSSDGPFSFVSSQL